MCQCEAHRRGIAGFIDRSGEQICQPRLFALREDIGEQERIMAEKPVPPVLITNDATSEAMGRLMLSNGESIGVFSSEGRKVLAIAWEKWYPRIRLLSDLQSGSRTTWWGRCWSDRGLFRLINTKAVS